MNQKIHPMTIIAGGQGWLGWSRVAAKSQE